MAVYKCKMCGGSLEIAEGQSVCTCEYCGTKQTVPNSHDEIIENLFNRANNLRLKCEFDKAEHIYEKIIDINNKEAEAHWGIVLCKYGIEYVEDPKTLNRIPTCHRTLYEAVLSDVDYLAAIENADAEQKELYTEEANVIDKLQKDILNIVDKEKPFDVFICYKETDESGERTVDSSLANDIYYQLTKEGLKVFYAAITLEDKLGKEYEPYIFAALNSAKVMLVIGTKPEYFDSVWVRNEWSRYLKLMKTDRERLLIPCYKDMDAYELPEQFAHLQAQDMTKIGFINDIVRGIKKVISKDSISYVDTSLKDSSNISAKGTVTAFLERGFIALEDEEWVKADTFFESALNFDAKLAHAYLGKLLAELKISRKEDLYNLNTVLNDFGNFEKAYRFGDSNLKQFLQSCNTELLEKRNRKIYNLAVERMDKSISEEDFKYAALKFKEILSFKNSVDKYEYCLNKAENIRKENIYLMASDFRNKNTTDYVNDAIGLYNSILDYKDSKEKIEECKIQIEEIKHKESELKRLKEEKIRKRNKNIKLALISLCSATALIIAFTLIVNLIFLPIIYYDKALEYNSEKEYLMAAYYFGKAEDYKDSKQQYYKLSNKLNQTVLSAGDTHSLGLKNNGTVVPTVYLGLDYSGQINVERWKKIMSVSAGASHSVGLKSDGTVLAVGNNDYGQCNVENWKNIVSISAGDSYTLGLKKDGTVLATGDNSDGQCNVSKWTDIIAISAGSFHSVGLKKGGTVVAVGYNDFNQCDLKNWKDITAVSTGSSHTVGLKKDGTVLAVGNSDNNRCDVSQWKNIVEISAGSYNTVGLKSDGTVIAVGKNNVNQCDVSDWKDIIKISAGENNTLGLTKYGTAVATKYTGYNYHGQSEVENFKNIIVSKR